MRAALASAFLVGQCGLCARTPPPPPERIDVVTAAPGRSSVEVEAELTVPLERALVSVPGVRAVDSESAEGRSKVTLTLDRSAEPLAARLAVVRALPRDTLPEGAQPELAAPVRGPPLLQYTLQGPLPETELRALQDWRVRPALLQVPGVGDVTACGGRLEQITVAIDGPRLTALGLSAGEVSEAISGATGDLEALRVARVAVKNGVPVLLRDVADLFSGGGPPDCVAVTGSGPVVAGAIWLSSSADAVATEKAVRDRIATEAARLPRDVKLEIWSGKTVKVRGEAPAGTSLEQTVVLGQRVLSSLGHLPQAEAALAQVRGKAIELEVRTRGTIDVAQLQTPGLELRNVESPAATLRVIGDDLTVLTGLAARVRASLRSLPGVTAVELPGSGTAPRQVIEPDRSALARFGLSARDVTEALELAHGGRTVGALTQGGRRVPIVVTVRGTSEVLVGAVPLSQVAAIRLATEPAVISRHQLRRCVPVQVYGKVEREPLQKALAGVELPPGVAIEFGE